MTYQRRYSCHNRESSSIIWTSPLRRANLSRLAYNWTGVRRVVFSFRGGIHERFGEQFAAHSNAMKTVHCFCFFSRVPEILPSLKLRYGKSVAFCSTNCKRKLCDEGSGWEESSRVCPTCHSQMCRSEQPDFGADHSSFINPGSANPNPQNKWGS